MGPWLHHHVLRVLFSCSLAWALLGLFMEQIFGWVSDAGRAVIETILVVAVATVCGATTWAITRRRSGFMAVPTGLSPSFWLTRSLLLPPFVAILTAIGFGLLAYARLRITGNPSDPQYGVSVAWAVVWYPAALTPLLSVIAIQRAAARESRRVSAMRRLQDSNVPAGGIQ